MTYVAQSSLFSIDAEKIDHPHFTAAVTQVDEERGVWEVNPMLREQYPVGLEGCWLVDYVFPDRQATDFDA